MKLIMRGSLKNHLNILKYLNDILDLEIIDSNDKL